MQKEEEDSHHSLFLLGKCESVGNVFIGQIKANHFYNHTVEQFLIRECREGQFPPVPADMHVTNLTACFNRKTLPLSTIPSGQYEPST